MVSSVFFILFFFTYSAIGSVLKEKDKRKLLNKVSSLQIPFIENKGQIEGKRVKYYAKTFGGTVFVTKDGKVVYSIPKFEKGNGLRGCFIQESFLGGSISHVKGGDEAITKVNYFKGKQPSQWRRNIPTYNLVSLGEIYKGIELKLKAYGKNVEKLFRVKPNAGSESIKVKIDGAKSLKVNEKGELEVETRLGVVKFTEPIAYQEENSKRKYVKVAYVVKGCEYSFKVGDYDRSKDLIIDPMLASTFVGGSYSDRAYAIALDQDGNVYVAGTTGSQDFPHTTAPLWKGWYDAFVSKFDSNLENLLASAFIGGGIPAEDRADDEARSLAIDDVGNIFVVGETSSSDFPATNPFGGNLSGDTDAFVLKLSSTLDDLLASVFVGGSQEETAYSVVLDNDGNVYVAGETTSENFYTSPGAYQEDFAGIFGPDCFVRKFDGNLQNILASTYLGGDDLDIPYSMVLDGRRNVYLAGHTQSFNFPTTPGAYDTIPETPGALVVRDSFVSKLDSNLQDLLASTYLGGTHYDSAKAITIRSVTGDYFQAVWGSSATDVYAVSDSTIYRYEGNNWSEERYYKLREMLCGVWGSSATDVYVVGGNSIYNEYRVLHYDGSAWSLLRWGSGWHYRGVWGSSATDVFVVGGSNPFLQESAIVAHYDGSSWSVTELARPGNDVHILYGVGAVQPQMFMLWVHGAPSSTTMAATGLPWAVAQRIVSAVSGAVQPQMSMPWVEGASSSTTTATTGLQ